jgi:hypothetical protein
MSPRIINHHVAQCPVIPAHGYSVHIGQCSCCGEPVIFCADGCTRAELLAAVGMEDEELDDHGPYVIEPEDE